MNLERFVRIVDRFGFTFISFLFCSLIPCQLGCWTMMTKDFLTSWTLEEMQGKQQWEELSEAEKLQQQGNLPTELGRVSLAWRPGRHSVPCVPL